MEIVKPESKVQLPLDELKATHDIYATIVMTYKQRIQWYVEEFKGVEQIISFCENMTKTIRAQIEEIEPPKTPDEKEKMQ